MNKTGLFSFISLLSLTSGANAALVITNFQVTSTTVSFDMNGVIDGPAESANLEYIDISNNANPSNFFNFGGAMSSSALADSLSFSGTQNLPYLVLHGNGKGYFELVFASALSVGESLNGSVSASWANPMIVTNNIPDTLNVRWGGIQGQGAPQGSFSTVSSVPEPTLAMLLGLASISCLTRRKRLVAV